MSKLIAREFKSFKSFFDYLKSQAISDLQAEVAPVRMARLLNIDGIGPKIVESLDRISRDEKWMSMINELMTVVEVLDNDSGISNTKVTTNQSKQAETRSSNRLVNRVILFTGKLRSLKRKEAEAICTQEGMQSRILRQRTDVAFVGAKVVDRFTVDVNLVVAADGEEAMSSKAKKAKEKGVEIWSEKVFQEFLQK